MEKTKMMNASYKKRPGAYNNLISLGRFSVLNLIRNSVQYLQTEYPVF
jgi:hypothetical protein